MNATSNFVFIVGKFPATSETFVLDHVLAMKSAGNIVTVIAERTENEIAALAKLKECGLENVVKYYDVPKSRFKKMIRSMAGLVVLGKQSPISTIRLLAEVCFFAPLSWNYLLIAHATRGMARKKVTVICHFGPNGLVGAALCKSGFLHGRLITIFHGNDVTAYIALKGRNVYQYLFKNGDWLFPVSSYFSERLGSLGCPPGKLKVHHVGIDSDSYIFSPRTRYEREITIVTVARLVEKKGHAYMLNAMDLLKNRGILARYVIVGDGPERLRLEAQARGMDLQDSVEFRGSATHYEVRQWMHACDLFVLPSVTAENGDQEGIPVSLMEAMAVGRLVITTRHSGIPELVRDGESGFLVQEKDAFGLAEAILRSLVLTAERRQEILREARNTIERDFNACLLNREFANFVASAAL